MPEYVLGTDQAELQRLGTQHRLWAAQAHAAWERARLRPDSRALDIGSGPGWATLDMAQIVGPHGTVVAVDESENYIHTLRQRADAMDLHNVHALCGDLHDLDTILADRPPFDVAYARWVLCFVRDPASIVAQTATHLAPGGRLAIHDYFNYACMTIAPRDPRFTVGINAIAQSWLDRGGSSDVMQHAPRFARQAGLRVLHFSVHQRIATPADPAWAWPDLFWKSFIPRLVTAGHLSATQARDFFDAWDAASANPDAFMHLPPVYEMIAERPAI